MLFDSDFLSALALIISAGVGLYTSIYGRRRSDSEAVNSIIDAASKAVDLREGDIALLEETLKMDQLYREYIDKGIIRLLKQLHDVEITPAFIPIPYDEFIRRFKEKKEHRHGRNK